MITYEDRLNSNIRWALLEGSSHFEKNNEVFATLFRLAEVLNDLNIA